jgi:hypothetical protein
MGLASGIYLRGPQSIDKPAIVDLPMMHCLRWSSLVNTPVRRAFFIASCLRPINRLAK